jgi:Holliday junction resolvase
MTTSLGFDHKNHKHIDSHLTGVCLAEFEWELVRAFNTFFEMEGIEAIAYRLRQARFSAQHMDVLVDSRYPEYYLAIECKSLATEGPLYFKQHFSPDQIERESRFVELSGRTGVLAVEFRGGRGRSKRAHLIPWSVVKEIRDSGASCLAIETVESYPGIPRVRGGYRMSHDTVSELYNACRYG